MLAISRMLIAAAQDRKGATAIEYGLIAAGLGVAIATIVFTVGDDLVGLFDQVSSRLKEGTGS